MTLKNVNYVIINENNETIKNEDGSLDIKTAEIEEFNVNNF